MSNTTHDDTHDDRLGAYLDGELSAEAAKAFEAVLERDPDLRDQAQALRTTNDVIRHAFDAPLHDTVPTRLHDTIEAGFAARRASAGSGADADNGAGQTTPAFGGLRWAASVAALIAGFGGGYWLAENRNADALAQLEALRAMDRSLIERTVNEVLEKQLSGTVVDWQNPNSGSHGTVTPIRTYRSEAGQWCREYVQVTQTPDGRTESHRAIACRETDGAWRMRAEIFEES